MKVNRLPVDPGPAAWDALLPAVKPRESVEQTSSVDWLIVGAGFTGLSAARRLGELHPSDNIVVLEAGTVATGPAGRNSGFMIDVPHDLTATDYAGNNAKDERLIRLNRAGIEYALDAKVAYGMSDETLLLSGKINGAITDRGIEHNAAYAQYLDSLSEPYEILDAKQMKSITGIDCYQHGLYTAGTAMLQPAMYIRKFASGIESNRLRIYENSPVLALTRDGSQWVAKTPKGQISAARVILGVNGHLESFGYYQRKLMHVFTYASMTRALSAQEVAQLGGNSTWALTPADALGTTVRRISGTGGDRLIIRNRATFDPTMRVSANRIRRVARDHDRSYKFRFPQLANVEMAYRWGGRLCLSRNNTSVFGEIEPNLFAACCQNGLGTAKGTASGKLIAELASEQYSSLLDDQQTDSEPTKLPPQPIASIGANAVLRWGEFRAGREL